MVYPNKKTVAARPPELSDTAENIQSRRPPPTPAINVSRPIGRLAGVLDRARRSILNKRS